MDHRRKYESIDKLLLYIIGALLTALSAGQLYYASNLRELGILSTQMISVMDNQQALIGKVGKIETQVRLGCERDNIYWENHKIDCGE